MRHIKLVLEEKDFVKLEKSKINLEQKKGERISWEKYFLLLHE